MFLCVLEAARRGSHAAGCRLVEDLGFLLEFTVPLRGATKDFFKGIHKEPFKGIYKESFKGIDEGFGRFGR